MKYAFLLAALLSSSLCVAASIPNVVQDYVDRADQLKLYQAETWQRLMYANKQGQSEVTYPGYFLAAQGQKNLQQELQQNIQALFQPAAENQSIHCKFPARSTWLMQQLQISEAQLPEA